MRCRMVNRREVLFCQLIVCASLFVAFKCQKCENNRLYYSPTLVCTNISERFPPFSKSVTSLQCIDCNIPSVNADTINNFRGDTFNLSYSHVQSISSDAFKAFDRTIHKFLFEDNNINYIGLKAFSNFSRIDDINLRKNNISQLPTELFDNTSVGTLDLSYNHISDISNSFVGLKVNFLNLSFNEISEIKENTFMNMTFWLGRQWRNRPQQLDLSNNLISKINSNIFKTLNSDGNTLKLLHIENNKLTTIDNGTFTVLKYLTHLNLKSNYISQLNSGSFKGLFRLNMLNLAKNKLETIPLNIFADLQQLDNLDLSQNHLTTFTANTFSGLTYLNKLNVSHNNLKILEDSHIFPLGRLVNLDISDTRLRDLDLSSILEHNYKLRVLVINDNFWTCKHLAAMYKQINKKTGGFDYPAHHYHVPNLHGIACSRVALGSNEDMTFEDFLNIIAQDDITEDLFDNKISSELNELSFKDVVNTIQNITGIFYMLLVITIVVLIIFLQYMVRCVWCYLNQRNIVQNNKFKFAYAQNQDNVELI